MHDIGFCYVETTSPKISEGGADDIDKMTIFLTKKTNDIDTTPIFFTIGDYDADISLRNVGRKMLITPIYR